MISKTKISKRLRKKTNPELAEAILIAKKNNLIELAKALSTSTRRQSKINLEDINKQKENIIIVPGKVLSTGEISKKTVYALGFSQIAKEKLKKSGSKFETILEALKKDNKLKGKILK
jgi:ribosomal protein L18E